MQFQIGAVLQHSNTPSLRVAGFEDEDEDDDEDENEAPHERHQMGVPFGRVGRQYRFVSLAPLSGRVLGTINPGLRPG